MNTKIYYVYIATNKTNIVLYTGVTNDLIRRIYEHKHYYGATFTKKYRIINLVYFEAFNNINLAIEREKQIKGGSRNDKLKLMVKNNPNFRDLYEQITI